jgi:hypothetical protein
MRSIDLNNLFDIHTISSPALNVRLREHKKWLESLCTNGVQAELTQVDLSSHNLSGVDLRWAKLWGSNLNGLNLMTTRLDEADLRWSTFIGAQVGPGIIKAKSLWGSHWDISAAPWVMLHPQWLDDHENIFFHDTL